jgi:uncharacterized glyoxalase superfamily protein PhnB
MQHLALVTLLVRDYDEAIAHYVGTLGFTLREDTILSSSKRWVVVAPSLATGGALLLAKADTDDQRASVGRQTGGRVGFFLHTDYFNRDYSRMKAAGVTFLEAPRREPYGTVAVFSDLYGNRWDLLEQQG